MSATDVRSAPGGGDYSGQTVLSTGIRMTDLANGPGENEAATVKDFDLGIPSAFADARSSIGSTCRSRECRHARPRVRQGGRQSGDVGVSPSGRSTPGPDGDIDPASGGLACPPTCGSGDEATFMRQGLFTP